MKTYKSHKVVEAAKITGLRAGDGGLLLCFRASPQVEVDGAWLTKHAPEQDPWKLIGGYFVRYPDGYTSWSPAGAFEEGYTAVFQPGRVRPEDDKSATLGQAESPSPE